MDDPSNSMGFEPLIFRETTHKSNSSSSHVFVQENSIPVCVLESNHELVPAPKTIFVSGFVDFAAGSINFVLTLPKNVSSLESICAINEFSRYLKVYFR